MPMRGERISAGGPKTDRFAADCAQKACQTVVITKMDRNCSACCGGTSSGKQKRSRLRSARRAMKNPCGDSGPDWRAGHSPASAAAQTFGMRGRRRAAPSLRYADEEIRISADVAIRKYGRPAIRKVSGPPEDGPRRHPALSRCIPSASVQSARLRPTFWSMPLIGRVRLRRMRPSAFCLRPSIPPRMIFS